MSTLTLNIDSLCYFTYRSGSMPDHPEHRYMARRNSGDHVNMNGVGHPSTPQLPPRTYRPPNHGRQRSQ